VPEVQQCLRPHANLLSSPDRSCCSPLKLIASIADFSHPFCRLTTPKRRCTWKYCLLQLKKQQNPRLPKSFAAVRIGGTATRSPLQGPGGRQRCCSLLHSYLPCKNNVSICKSPLAVDTCIYTNALQKTGRHVSQFTTCYLGQERYRQPACTVKEGRSQHKFIRNFEILCANTLTVCKSAQRDSIMAGCIVLVYWINKGLL